MNNGENVPVEVEGISPQLSPVTSLRSDVSKQDTLVSTSSGPGSDAESTPFIAHDNSSIPHPQPPSRRRHYGLLSLIFLNLSCSLVFIALPPVASSAKTYFSLPSATVINWQSTLGMFAYVPASILSAHSVRRFGVRNAMCVGAVMMAVGVWLRYAGARSVEIGVVILGQVFVGFAQAFFLNVPAYYSNMWYGPHARITTIALMSLSNPLGQALGSLIAPFVASSPSQIPFWLLICALIASVSTISALLIPGDHAHSSPSHTAPTTLKSSIRQLGRNRRFLCLLVQFSVYVGFFNAFTFLLEQLLTPSGLSPDAAGIAGAITILSGLVASALFSPFMDRRTPAQQVRATQVLTAIVAGSYVAFIALLATTGTRTPVAEVYVICAMLGAASFILLPLSLEKAVSLTHPTGVGVEISTTAMWIGGELLGGIFIVIMDAFRSEGDVGDGGGGVFGKGGMGWGVVFMGVVSGAAVPFAWMLGGEG
ncbi:MFS general substrate transporter [Saitoella complicata NRRL Y-17804]|nr:MFS general substrate transporter [Saitoella complicata NRRL Y-17804]ODQ52567.1 MFS general substrate transporter [Saitoella complicata NRRL Y-17804]